MKNHFNSIENVEGVEDDKAKKELNEALNSLKTKQQLLIAFMDKWYLIYQFKKNLIYEDSKSTLYYYKYNENGSFGRMTG